MPLMRAKKLQPSWTSHISRFQRLLPIVRPLPVLRYFIRKTALPIHTSFRPNFPCTPLSIRKLSLNLPMSISGPVSATHFPKVLRWSSPRAMLTSFTVRLWAAPLQGEHVWIRFLTMPSRHLPISARVSHRMRLSASYSISL